MHSKVGGCWYISHFLLRVGAGLGSVGGEFWWPGLKAVGGIQDCSVVSFDAFVLDIMYPRLDYRFTIPP